MKLAIAVASNEVEKTDAVGQPLEKATPLIQLERIHKIYSSGDVEMHALRGVSMNIYSGEFVAIMGTSGSGKSTMMNILGCLDRPTRGSYLLDGEDISQLEKDERADIRNRKIGFVFQGFNLLSRTSALENIELPLLYANVATEERHQRAIKALQAVGLAGREESRPNQLSGGQQQRVALARAIVNRPSVLLLDEPLAALDKKLRSAMQIELQTLQRELGITFVLVTHDQEEALSMADIVCVMSAGRIRQLGSPQEVYDRPADLFVADFVGKTNRVKATMEADGATLRLADGSAIAAGIRAGVSAGEAIVAIRPESIRLTRMQAPDIASFKGTVTHRIFLGSSAEYAVTVPGLGDFLVTADRRSMNESDLVEPGEAVYLGFDPGAAHVFSASSAA